jgi:hypothetical protein
MTQNPFSAPEHIEIQTESIGDERISQILHHYAQQSHPEHIPVQSLAADFSDRALGFMLLLFGLICLVPIPGIRSILTIPIFFIAGQIMMGKTSLWLPAKLMKLELPRDGFLKMIKLCLPYVEQAELYIKPRLKFLAHGVSERFFGFMAFLGALIIAIPLPLTNAVPAFGIIAIALGFLNRDGFLLILGMVLIVGWAVVLSYIYIGLLTALFSSGFAFFAR